MKLLEINNNSKYLNTIKEIYHTSIPESERIDFEDLVNHAFPNSKILGIFNNNNLVGFSFVSVLGEFAYIVYLAIAENQRNNGYGSKALTTLFNLYSDKTKVLCVEKPNSKNDLRTRRINFYNRNGFTLSNFEFEYLGDYYYSMYNGKFDKEKFIDFLLICFPGCKNFKDIK